MLIPSLGKFTCPFNFYKQAGLSCFFRFGTNDECPKWIHGIHAMDNQLVNYCKMALKRKMGSLESDIAILMFYGTKSYSFCWTVLKPRAKCHLSTAALDWKKVVSSGWHRRRGSSISHLSLTNFVWSIRHHVARITWLFRTVQSLNGSMSINWLRYIPSIISVVFQIDFLWMLIDLCVCFQ